MKYKIIKSFRQAGTDYRAGKFYEFSNADKLLKFGLVEKCDEPTPAEPIDEFPKTETKKIKREKKNGKK